MNGLALCAGLVGSNSGSTSPNPDIRTWVSLSGKHEQRPLVARMADSPLGEAPVWDDVATFDGGRWRAVLSEYPDLAPGG